MKIDLTQLNDEMAKEWEAIPPKERENNITLMIPVTLNSWTADRLCKLHEHLTGETTGLERGEQQFAQDLGQVVSQICEDSMLKQQVGIPV